MSGLSDYLVERDHFEADTDDAIFSPCRVCKHKDLAFNEDPCRTCDHNANAEAPEGPSDRRLETALAEARELIRRYREETPLGYQPHMIADKADHWLLANAK